MSEQAIRETLREQECRILDAYGKGDCTSDSFDAQLAVVRAIALEQSLNRIDALEAELRDEKHATRLEAEALVLENARLRDAATELQRWAKQEVLVVLPQLAEVMPPKAAAALGHIAARGDKAVAAAREAMEATDD